MGFEQQYHRAATIGGGVQAVNNGCPGDAPVKAHRPERDGEDAAELLHLENPHSIANQLKEAAEFWEVFDTTWLRGPWRWRR